MDGPCMNRLQERQCGMQRHPFWTANSSSLRKRSTQLGSTSHFFPTWRQILSHPTSTKSFHLSDLICIHFYYEKIASWYFLVCRTCWNAHTSWKIKICLGLYLWRRERVLGFDFFTDDHFLWLGYVETILHFSLIWLYFSHFAKGTVSSW